MTLQEAFRDDTFINALDNLDLETCYKILDKAAYNNELYNLLLEENINPLVNCSFVEAYQFHKLNTSSIIIPNSVHTIGFGAFSRSTVEHLFIPPTVEYIGEITFSDCRELKSADIQATLEYLNDGTFSGCKSLKNVILSDNIELIGYSAFFGTALEHIKIPKKCNMIKKEAFENCTSLEEVDIPDSVKVISEGAFRFCDLDKLYFKCNKGSYAEGYAKANNIRIVYN